MYLGNVGSAFAAGIYKDVIRSLPGGIGSLIKVGTLAGDFAFRIDALTTCVYHAQWSINAAKVYYPEYIIQLKAFGNNPIENYDDFVKASATFGSLVSAEWKALADLTDEHSKNWWVYMCNGFEIKGWEGDTPEEIVLDMLRSAIDNFYNDYISQYGIFRQEWPK